MEQVSAQKIGEELYKRNDNKMPDELKPLVKHMTEYSIALIEDEIMMLNIFITDFAAQSILGSNSPAKKAILDAFYSCWEKMASDVDVPDIIDDIKERLWEYSRALKTTHTMGPAFTIGKAFAKFCDYEMDAGITFIGSSIFITSLVGRRELFKSLQEKFEITT